MNRTKKELYKKLDKALKKMAVVLPIEDICTKALLLMKDAYIAQLIQIKLNLQFLISIDSPLEVKIKDLKRIKSELEESNKATMIDMMKMRKTLDNIEKNHKKEIKDLNWAIDTLIEGMQKKLEKEEGDRN